MGSMRFHIRVDEDELETFKEKSKEIYGKDHNDLFREMMVAASEGRLKITPTAEQLKTMKTSGELYDVN